MSNESDAQSLPAAERDALATLALFQAPFWAQTVHDLLPAVADLPQLLQRWLALSLLQLHQTDANGNNWYVIPAAVHDHLVNQLDENERAVFHRHLAAYYGRPFVAEARQYLAGQGQQASEAQIESLARDRNGVLGHWVHQTQNVDHARLYLIQAMAWQDHLFQAGEVEAAGEVVTAIYDMLARWGHREQAKALLQRSVNSRQSNGRAVALGNLATLLQEEGKLAEALAIYQELSQTFAALGAGQQMAATLGQMSTIYSQLGDYELAINCQNASLEIMRGLGSQEGEAIGLQQLAALHHSKGDLETALTHSQAAEQLNRQLNRHIGIAFTLHQQGLIFSQTGRLNEAFARFQESWTINQQIGHEVGAADNLGELGKLLYAVGQMEPAITAFNQAYEIYQRYNNPKMAIVAEFLRTVQGESDAVEG